MMASMKYIEPGVAEIVMDNSVAVEAVVEIMVDIEAVAASEAMIVVIGVVDVAVLVVVELLVHVDQTKHKLQA